MQERKRDPKLESRKNKVRLRNCVRITTFQLKVTSETSWRKDSPITLHLFVVAEVIGYTAAHIQYSSLTNWSDRPDWRVELRLLQMQHQNADVRFPSISPVNLSE